MHLKALGWAAYTILSLNLLDFKKDHALKVRANTTRPTLIGFICLTL